MKKSILIISNENNLSPVLGKKLLEQGYDVNVTSETGERLKSLLDETYPDLVIISLIVSCLEAIELTLKVRSWCHIPLILVNNWATIDITGNTDSCLLLKTDTVDGIMSRIENAFSRN